MSHERYPLRERLKNHWRNPEWAKLAAMPIKDTQPELPKVNFPPQAEIYPISTAQPEKRNTIREEVK